jgi:hypothetical protein
MAYEVAISNNFVAMLTSPPFLCGSALKSGFSMLKVKINFALEQNIKAQKGNRDIDLFFL